MFWCYCCISLHLCSTEANVMQCEAPTFLETVLVKKPWSLFLSPNNKLIFLTVLANVSPKINFNNWGYTVTGSQAHCSLISFYWSVQAVVLFKEQFELRVITVQLSWISEFIGVQVKYTTCEWTTLFWFNNIWLSLPPLFLHTMPLEVTPMVQWNLNVTRSKGTCDKLMKAALEISDQFAVLRILFHQGLTVVIKRTMEPL